MGDRNRDVDVFVHEFNIQCVDKLAWESSDSEFIAWVDVHWSDSISSGYSLSTD